MKRIDEVLSQLPFNVKRTELYLGNCFRLYTDKETYLLRYMNEKDISGYNTLCNLTKRIMRHKDEYNGFYLFGEEKNHGESKAIAKNLFREIISIFDNTKEPRILKKDAATKLQTLYQVLDDRFRYIELRIRAVEMKKSRIDADWIVLSKYKIILASKMKLYHLQEKMFSIIDKEPSVYYGLILPNPNVSFFINDKISENYDLSLGPISSLMARFYVENEHIDSFKNEIKGILDEYRDEFYKIHFSFLVFYILILSITVPRVITNYSISNYLALTKKLVKFYTDYNDYLE